jgi:hypothetical protein
MTTIERRREEAGHALFHLLRYHKGKRAVVIAAAERINRIDKGDLHYLLPKEV